MDFAWLAGVRMTPGKSLEFGVGRPSDVRFGDTRKKQQSEPAADKKLSAGIGSDDIVDSFEKWLRICGAEIFPQRRVCFYADQRYWHIRINRTYSKRRVLK